MILIIRLEKKEVKLEKKINKQIEKIEDLNHKFQNNLISKKKYCAGKKRIEDIIKILNVRLRITRGEMAKRKRLAIEKGNKNEERKRREKNYFEWCKKHENI